MGRRRKHGKNLKGRKKLDETKVYYLKQPKILRSVFNDKDCKKLHDGGVNRIVDLQETCKVDPEKLMKIPGFGPIKVKAICKKVGVIKSIKNLQIKYNKIKRKPRCFR